MRRYSSCILLIFFFTTLSAQTATPPAAGDGSIGNPYQIANLDNLYWIATDETRWGFHYIQTADIDAAATSGWIGGKGWAPIGTDYTHTTLFTGSYNGYNHTISNLYINNPIDYYGALFGRINGASIQNLGMINVNITGYQSTGGLVGYAENNSIISHCYSTGSVNGDSGTGGLVGSNITSIIDNSYSNAAVNGKYSVGGFAGRNQDNASISNCYSTGNVNGLAGGGFVGHNTNNSIIKNCYSRSSVNRSSGFGTNFGAFAATNDTYSTIEYCYSTGSVTYSGASNPSDMGFVGLEYTMPIYNSNFWDNTVSNQSSATGATSKTTTEMKNIATFTDLATTGLTTPWDFVANPNDDSANINYWGVDDATNNGYPFLRQQNIACFIFIYVVEVSDNHLAKARAAESTGFIELWNDRSVPLSLDGYFIRQGTNDGSGFVAGPYSYAIPNGYTIPVDGFLVIGNGADLSTFNAAWGTALTASEYNAGNSSLDIANGHAYAISNGSDMEQNETPEVISGDRIHQEPGGVWITDPPSNGSPGDFGDDVPLPVKLTSFTVESVLTGVQCKWTTESEIENLGFILERKNDRTDWTEITSYKNNDALRGQGTVSYAVDYSFTDNLVEATKTYEYRIADVDYNGVITYHATRTVTVEQAPLSTKVTDFTVLPAYPNPFNPSTTIRYGLENDSNVNVDIYDVSGKLITTLVNTYQTQGWHSIVWNGTNTNGSQVSAGIYLTKITSNSEVRTNKLMLLK